MKCSAGSLYPAIRSLGFVGTAPVLLSNFPSMKQIVLFTFAPYDKSSTTKYLATGDEKVNLRIWKIPDGESTIWVNYPTGIQSLAFSPNGTYLAVALWDTTIQILR